MKPRSAPARRHLALAAPSRLPSGHAAQIAKVDASPKEVLDLNHTSTSRVPRRHMMQAQQQISRRTVARIEDRIHLGPDAQVDDKSLMFSAQDPALTDPFLVLVEDLFSEPGFEWHPHRGLETVTLVRDGVLEHGDSIGNSGTLTTTSSALTHWPISGSLITMEPGRSLDHFLPGQDRAFFTVLAGAVSVADRTVTAGQTAWSDPLSDADLSVIGLRTGDGDAPSEVLTFSGPPIRQPVAMGGPMVMNTRAEIEQAFRDFHAGSFGAVPRQARLQYR
ncbi:pirin-like C-terminal cupin domain-containing protein [Streptomyces sp. NPDC050759]|uniref:pirin-like C-terminal cupin domain-containing protein n=1 Tax=Streptomyces sp. NPDC050759 TaxID=3365635 RepID=UPI0037B8F952